jgi:hypothetical protein
MLRMLLRVTLFIIVLVALYSVLLVTLSAIQDVSCLVFR